jgi:glycerol-3-phosphate dehydrogenase
MNSKTDVLIIGGGIAGTAIARELSKYEINVTLVEKEVDVGWGQTKASYAICHPGARWAPGTLAQAMIAESNQAIDQLMKDLDVDFRRLGELILTFNGKELEYLKAIKKQGEHIRIEGLEIIDKNEIQRLEPNANPAAIGALYMPTAGIFNPFELVQAFYENARENGVDMLMGTKVTNIVREKENFKVETDRNEIQAAYVVNAAGLHAAKIAEMVGAGNFTVSYATKGTCFVIDNCMGDIVNHIITGLVDLQSFTRFKLVMPTYAGNILIYTSISEPAHGIDDRAVEQRALDLTLESARSLVPDVDFERHIIASFSGLTARNDRGDFIIETSDPYSGFVNVALPPPGLTCSPVIGQKVAGILKKYGLVLIEKINFNPHRRGINSVRASSSPKIRELLRQDPRYGKVVCRCEKVTEAEIIDAVQRGASTLDGVKFRTRAGMGRCQGNFCGPQSASILARELDQPLETITKNGPGSNFVI